MRYIALCLLAVAPVALYVPTDSLAQEQFVRIGTFAAQVLEYPRGARSVSMGWVGAADDTDPANVFYNPANIFLSTDFSATQSYNDWIADISFLDVGAAGGRAFRTERPTQFRLAGCVRYTALSNDAPDRVIFLPDGESRSFDFTDWYLTLALAGGVSTEMFDAGVGFAAKPLRLGFSDKSAWAFDVGLLAKAKLALGSDTRIVPSVGMSVLNMGSSIDFGTSTADLPGEKRVGLGVRFEASNAPAIEERFGRRVPIMTIAANSDYVWRSGLGAEDAMGVGFELGFIEVVALRLGFYDHLRDTGGSSITTYGVGLQWTEWNVTFGFDYARHDLWTSDFIFDSVINTFGFAVSYSF
jgi:hypothetical protein